MHVLQVVPTIDFGGAELMVLNLTRGLRERGIETTLATLGALSDSAGGLLRSFGIEDASVVEFRKGLGFDPRTVWRLRDVFRQGRPDVVHTHQHALRYVLAASVGAQFTPCWHTLHTPETAQRGWVTDLMHREARRRGVHPVAVAPAIADGYGVRAGYRRVDVVPNGVDIRRFTPDASAGARWRADNGLPADAILFVCVARFYPVKNQQLLVRAFARIAGECPLAQLVLVGDGPLRSALEAASAASGVSGRVHFAGVRPDVERALQGSDIFVLTSLWEGNPMSILEAMAVGLPVVAPRVGGVPDAVADGETGLIFEPDDEAHLCEMMLAMYRNRELRARCGETARRVAESVYSVDSMVAHYLELYLGGLAGSAGVPELPGGGSS